VLNKTIEEVSLPDQVTKEGAYATSADDTFPDGHDASKKSPSNPS